ncbi:hypothetical protein DWW31_14085 [Clostridium sp. AF15-17LB]|nr:hypothetical protein DWW31_14085 [Clostridium sp. AF15-17LB]
MIRCEKGNVSIEGTGCTILAEVSTILRAAREMAAEAYEDRRLADELIGEAIRMSRMTDQELQRHQEMTFQAFFKGGI